MPRASAAIFLYALKGNANSVIIYRKLKHITQVSQRRWEGRVEKVFYLNEMVFRARSATARAFSISAVSRWKAMYLIHTIELFGDCRTSWSKSSAISGARSESSNCFSLCFVENYSQLMPRERLNKKGTENKIACNRKKDSAELLTSDNRCSSSC